MSLKALKLKDKPLFEAILQESGHELSSYAFENIYIWKRLFDICWSEIDANLCLFFKDKGGCFLYLSPLGKHLSAHSIEKVFKIMDTHNRNRCISRIENVEEKDLSLYRSLGYECREKFPEYLCKRTDLAELKGNRFKSKRASYNYFVDHYTFKYLPFSLNDRLDCLALYDEWAGERKAKHKDHIFQGMLEDSRNAFTVLLRDFAHLNFTGRVVRVKDKIKACTFGYRLNNNTFTIAYEIADVRVKGLSQFIFREFCRELDAYRSINIMDDSGLENLEAVKLSYRPTRIIPAFIVARKNA